MKFTTYSEAHLKGLKKDELIDLYKQLEDNLKSEIAENETTMNYIRAVNIKITEQHKKDIIKVKKEAVKEFADTLIYKLDHLKSIKVNLGFDTTALTFRKEVLLDLISVTKIEQCSQADKLKTNADRIRNLSDEELADFINDIASDSIATISYGTQEYTEIWEDREETIKYLKAEIEKNNDKTLNRNTDDYER